MGIGHEGKTLRQTLEDRDRNLEQTGHLYGLGRLELHEQDLTRMMRFESKLLEAAISAREIGKLIAGSPTIRSYGECNTMILVPEGDVVVAGLGLGGHCACTPVMIKNIAQLNYEDNPGIRPGDIFCNNDPLYGAPHNGDVYTLVPIFYQGELIAWAATFVHGMDIGAPLCAGTTPTIGPTHFTDGLTIPLMKVGENFTTFKWFELLWERQTRLPVINLLDDRMRVTSCKMMHDKVIGIVKEFGGDYFREGLREILERERRRLQEFLKDSMVPGLYEEVVFWYLPYKGLVGTFFPFADKNWLQAYATEIRLTADGDIHIDLEGSSSQDWHHMNAYEGALRMGFGWWWMPMLIYGGPLNTAADHLLKIKAPQGSIYNPSNPQLGSAMGLCTGGHLITPMYRFSCRALFSRGFLEEAIGETFGGGCEPSMEGVLRYGTPWTFIYFTHAGGGAGGARPHMDGVSACGSWVLPESDYGEDEEWEPYMPPWLVIGKGLLTNGCSHGRFRPGLPIETLLLIVDPVGYTMQNTFLGGTIKTTESIGLSGGYPSAGAFGLTVRNTNMRQLIEAGEGYPGSMREVIDWLSKGKLTGKVDVMSTQSPPTEMKDGDLYAMISHFRNAWGDPLERDWKLIEDDLNMEYITTDVAEKVYGAVIKNIDGRWEVNIDASNKVRENMRRRRREGAITTKEWWRRERQMVREKQFSEDVYNLYRDVLKYEKFRCRFLGTWQLPQDYHL
jgi:acetone carboxylase alpha subunit